MIRSLILSAPFVLACTVQAQAPTVKPVALHVMPTLDKNDQEVFPLGGTGTSVTVIVSTPGKCLVALDRDACKLQSYTDDTGTDLTKSPRTGVNNSPRWIGEDEFRLNDAGERGRIGLVAGGTPAASAKQITIKATLRLLCGADAKIVERNDVSFDPVAVNPKANKFKIGDFSVLMGPGMVLVDSNQPNVRGIEVLDAAGDVVDVTSTTKAPRETNDKGSYRYGCTFQKAAMPLTVKIAYFNTIEAVDIPVDLTIGVGF